MAGEKKGTYYIRVQAYKIGRGKRYAVVARLYPYQNQGGTYSNPRYMSRGTTYVDIFGASNTTDYEYYQFYANGNSPVYLKISTTTCQGSFYAIITGPSWPNGNKQTLANDAVTTLTLKRVYTSTGASIGPKPGTYTVKICRNRARSNAMFKLVWSY